jgi:hypothetical protein
MMILPLRRLQMPMLLLGSPQASANQVDLFRRGFDSRLRFLLEGVEYVDGIGETQGVDGAIGIGVIVFDNLNDPGAAKASKRLGRRVLGSRLRKLKGIANIPADADRKSS